jgi:hypothetical protein
VGGHAYKRLLIGLVAIIAAELLGLAFELLRYPSSSCSSNFSGLLGALGLIGAGMFVTTSLGTMWRGFLERRIVRRLESREAAVNEVAPVAARRIASLRGRFAGTLALGDSMFRHPWLTGTVAGLSAIVLFAGLFIVGVAASPNSCG